MSKTDTKNVEQIEVGLHLGNALHHLAHLYAEPPVVIRECVQNAIDKGAKHVLVIIDAVRRTIKSYDDGLGAAFDEIKQKFNKVAMTLKLDPKLMGEKGIGNLAGLSVAETYHIITKPRDSQEPLKRYSLSKADLMGKEKVSMSVEDWPGKGIGGGTSFPATTLVQLLGVNDTALRRLSNFDVIERVILEAFAMKIRENKIEVKICFAASAGKSWERKVEPGKFRGTKQQPEAYETKFGPVVFQMYYSEKPLDNPNLVIEHKGKYSISLSNLNTTGQMSTKAWDAFKKGYFEGIIKLDFGTISPHRGSFEWDDELMAFNDKLEEFALEVLRPAIELVEAENREEKFRQVSDHVLKRVTSFFEVHPEMRPEFLRDVAITTDQPGDREVPPPRPKTDPREIVRKRREAVEQERRDPRPKAADQGGARGTSTGKPSRRPGNLFAIEFVVPDEEFGLNWHSRRVDAAVQVNTQNTDFTLTQQLGMSKLKEYVFLLVQKELTCASLEPSSARLFGDRFEDTFMALYRTGIGQ